MFSDKPMQKFRYVYGCGRAIVLIVLVLGCFFLGSARLAAQEESKPAPDAGSQKQEPPTAAGGPQSDVGPYGIPKKKEGPSAPPPIEKHKRTEGMPDYSIRVDVL